MALRLTVEVAKFQCRVGKIRLRNSHAVGSPAQTFSILVPFFRTNLFHISPGSFRDLLGRHCGGIYFGDRIKKVESNPQTQP